MDYRQFTDILLLAGTVLKVLAHGGTFFTVLHHDGIFLAVLKNTVLFKREADSRFLTVPPLAVYGIANFDGIPLPSRIRLLRRENRDGKIPEEYPGNYRCPVCNSYQLMTYRALCCRLSPCCCLAYTSYIWAIESHLRC